MKRITIGLDPDIIAELDQLAAEANVSRAWMGREIIRRTLRGLPMAALLTLPEHRPGAKVGATGSDIDVPIGETPFQRPDMESFVVPVNPARPARREARPDPKGNR